MRAKRMIQVVSLVGLMMMLVCGTWAQPPKVYHHPTLNIQFEAPPDWRTIPHPEDQSIYEVVSVDTTIHVWIYHAVTSFDGPSYLEKLATLKGLKFKGEPLKVVIKDKEGFELEASGLIKQKPIRMILTALPYQDGFFIIQIWSPEQRFMDLQHMMRGIQGSLRITG